MAIILRGKKKGESVKIHQFCNDWFMTEDGKIVNPTSLSFSLGEIEMIITAAKKGQTGIMFGLFKWDGNRLKRK